MIGFIWTSVRHDSPSLKNRAEGIVKQLSSTVPVQHVVRISDVPRAVYDPRFVFWADLESISSKTLKFLPLVWSLLSLRR